MTLARLAAFSKTWESAPPLAESVAAFIGIKTHPAPNITQGIKPGLPQMLADVPTIKLLRPA